MYKCQNKLMPDYITNLFRTVDSVHSYQKPELQNQEIYILQNRCIVVHKSLSQTKVLKYGMKSLVRFEIPEQFIASKKNQGSIT